MLVYICCVILCIAESDSRVSGSSKEAQGHYSDLLETPVYSPKPNQLEVKSMSITVSPKGTYVCAYVCMGS